MKAMLKFLMYQGNSDDNLRSMVAKIMNIIPKQKSAPRAECMFSLSGGALKRSSFGFTRICFVNEHDLVRVKD